MKHFLSEHPRLRRFLTAWLIMLVGSLVGYMVLSPHGIGLSSSIKIDGIVDLGLMVVTLVALPFMSAILGPLAVSCVVAALVLRHPAGSPLTVALIMTMSGLFYVLLICAYDNAFSNRWPWLRWVWRVYLFALSASGMYAVITIGSQ